MCAMTPITDDQVLSVMTGLEAREKRAMKRLAAATSDLPAQPGDATARVLIFHGGPVAQRRRRLVPADVIPLAAERTAQAARKTVHGRFISIVPIPVA
jgi:hypothetical protein